MNSWHGMKMLGAVLGLMLSAQAADMLPGPPILPASPKDLLGALPATPKEWKLVRSRGENLYSQWMLTEVVREYEQVSPPGVPAPNPPVKTQVRIMDTGYWPAANGMFLNASVGDEKSGMTRTVWNGMPLVEMKGTESRPAVAWLWAKKRFVVTVMLWGQKPREAEDWLRRVDLSTLEKIPDRGEKTLPQPLSMQVVDELEPKKTRTYDLFWTSPETVYKHLQGG